jgi:hypothetical protein
MNANDLIVRAQDLCRALGRSFPTEIKTSAWDWQRQQYDLAWCWGTVQSALRQGRALCNVEAEVHRHHARLQSEKDARDRKAGEPLRPPPGAGQEPWWETQRPEQDTESPQSDLPSPASTGGVPDDLDGVRPGVEPQQVRPGPRQPYRKRKGTKADRVRELLKGPCCPERIHRGAQDRTLRQR